MGYYPNLKREIECIKPVVNLIRDVLDCKNEKEIIEVPDLIKKLDIQITCDKDSLYPELVMVDGEPCLQIKRKSWLTNKKWKLKLIQLSLCILYIKQSIEYPISSEILYTITKVARELEIPTDIFLEDIKEITREQKEILSEDIYWLSIKYGVSEQDIYNKGYRIGVFKSMFD